MKSSPNPEQSTKMLKSYMDQSLEDLTTVLDKHGISLNTLSSAMVRFIQSIFDLPEGTACRKGCAHCCHLRVGVSIAEAIVIFDQIKQNATDKGLEFLKQKVIHTAQKGNTLEDAWWLISQTSCPFLDTQDQNLCMIYDLRPFSCRAYHSTDVSVCRSGFEQAQTAQIPCFPFYRAFTDMYSTVFIKVMAQRGLASYQVGLVAVLGILFESDDAGEEGGHLIEEWFSGKDVFKAARLS
ncbi:MAG: YkgJ family cysteine cluster protein [Candidatus Anammoxibacter sp.]